MWFLIFVTGLTEEAYYNKLAAQSIHRELLDVDEAKSLEEEGNIIVPFQY